VTTQLLTTPKVTVAGFLALLEEGLWPVKGELVLSSFDLTMDLWVLPMRRAREAFKPSLPTRRRTWR